jgi:hypothetical protein
LLLLAYLWVEGALEGESSKDFFDASVGFVLLGLVPASIVRAWAVSLERREGGPSARTPAAA